MAAYTSPTSACTRHRWAVNSAVTLPAKGDGTAATCSRTRARAHGTLSSCTSCMFLGVLAQGITADYTWHGMVVHKQPYTSCSNADEHCSAQPCPACRTDVLLILVTGASCFDYTQVPIGNMIHLHEISDHNQLWGQQAGHESHNLRSTGRRW